MSKLRNIWLALIGKTFVSFRGYCFKCECDYTVEMHQSENFARHRSCMCVDANNFDMIKFNGRMFYPKPSKDNRHDWTQKVKDMNKP